MSSLTYKKLQETHLSQVDNHLIKCFFTKEPLGVALGATDPQYFKDWIQTYTGPIVKLQEASYGCFDGELLVGVEINSIVYKESSKNVPTISEVLGSREKDHPLLKIFKFMEEEVYNGIDIFENVDVILYPALLSVDPKYMGKRIGTQLLKLSEDEARTRGIKEITVETTGKYSANIFEKMGYSRLKSVPYNETKAIDFHNLGEHTAANLWRKKI